MCAYDKLQCFLKNRIYLIDINKCDNELLFIVEESFSNYEIILNDISIRCSCKDYKNRNIVCKHIKFILPKIDSARLRKSKSCSSLNEINKLFLIDLKTDLDPQLFKTDRNPRYKEYKILEDNDYTGNCLICLRKLSQKIIRCKTCSKYYHNDCIYGWLRYGPACTCPNCRSQWI